MPREPPAHATDTPAPCPLPQVQRPGMEALMLGDVANVKARTHPDTHLDPTTHQTPAPTNHPRTTPQLTKATHSRTDIHDTTRPTPLPGAGLPAEGPVPCGLLHGVFGAGAAAEIRVRFPGARARVFACSNVVRCGLPFDLSRGGPRCACVGLALPAPRLLFASASI